MDSLGNANNKKAFNVTKTKSFEPFGMFDSKEPTMTPRELSPNLAFAKRLMMPPLSEYTAPSTPTGIKDFAPQIVSLQKPPMAASIVVD